MKIKIIVTKYRFRFKFFSKFEPIQRRVFRRVTLQSVGDLTSAPETGTKITSQ